MSTNASGLLRNCDPTKHYSRSYSDVLGFWDTFLSQKVEYTGLASTEVTSVFKRYALSPCLNYALSILDSAGIHTSRMKFQQYHTPCIGMVPRWDYEIGGISYGFKAYRKKGWLFVDLQYFGL